MPPKGRKPDGNSKNSKPLSLLGGRASTVPIEFEPPVDHLFAKLRQLLEGDALGAVVVHMNDTYRIEEMRSADGSLQIPGMARIAGLIDSIRTQVKQHVGEDRTLVLHSGDFLSPSFVSATLGNAGEHMVDVLGLCGVDWITLGNHEFDYEQMGTPARLAQQLKDAPFGLVISNLSPPEGYPFFESDVFWPRENPFLAIVGIAGEKTSAVAAKWGFSRNSWSSALEDVVERVRADERITCLVALTHMDRSEDLLLAKEVNKRWRSRGRAWVLGGHDHNISWRELLGSCSFSKNFLNGRSVTISLLTNRLIAAPSEEWGTPSPKLESREERKERMRRDGQHSPRDMAKKITQLEINETIKECINFYTERAKPCRRMDFMSSYINAFKAWAERPTSSSLIAQEIFYAQGAWAAFQDGYSDITADFYDKEMFFQLPGASFDRVHPNSLVEKRIDQWLRRVAEKAPAGKGTVADFSALNPLPIFDAQETSLRSRSTNFGNLVAESVRIGLNSDVAVVHAGCLRKDDEIRGGKIFYEDLAQTFTFRPDPVAVKIRVGKREVEAIYKHASEQAGDGGFLQTSHSLEEIMTFDDEEIELGIPLFLLTNDQDGYRTLLLNSLEWTEKMLELEISRFTPKSLLSLVAENASKVHYREDIRLVGLIKLTPEEELMRIFIITCRDLVSCCVEVGLSHGQSFGVIGELPDVRRDVRRKFRESNRKAQYGPDDYHRVRRAWRRLLRLRNSVLDLVLDFVNEQGWDSYHALYKRLTERPERFIDGIDYARFLDIIGQEFVTIDK